MYGTLIRQIAPIIGCE